MNDLQKSIIEAQLATERNGLAALQARLEDAHEAVQTAEGAVAQAQARVSALEEGLS